MPGGPAKSAKSSVEDGCASGHLLGQKPHELRDLERLGYVVRQHDPDDRRAKQMILTERGQACVAAAMSTIASLEAELDDLLGSAALDDLHDSLRRIVTADRSSRPPR